MTTTEARYTTNEMMAVVLSRLLADGEIGFIGVGSSGRAYELVTQIPLQAALLAQLRGVDFEIQIGPLIGVDLQHPPARWFDNDVYGWNADALLDSDWNMEHFVGGRVSVGFISGAQIDEYGNVNVLRVRGDGGWKRLGGALALPEHCAFAGRAVLLADLSARVFVPRVDFVTGVGHRVGQRTRVDLGLPGAGPVVAVTDRALLGFDAEGTSIRLLYPGVKMEDVDQSMSYRARRRAKVEIAEQPSDEELEALRSIALPPLPW